MTQRDVSFVPSKHNQRDAVRSYLTSIGRVPLLSQEEEIEYARKVQAMRKCLQAKEELTFKLGHTPSSEQWAVEAAMTVDELEAVIKAGTLARKQMIEANLRLVVNIAKQYRHCNMDFLDLIQEGSMGLHQGVEKFDPSRGYKFSTYAYWWIRQAMTRAISQSSRTIRLPIHLVEILGKIRRSQRLLSQQFGRSATIKEVASNLELEPAKVRQYLDYGRLPISLEKRVGENGDSELQDILEDQSASPSENLQHMALRQDMEDTLAELSPTMREVLIMRFGLDGGHPLSLAEAGRRLGMSRERVRQIQQRAFTIIRHRSPEIQHHLAK
jgi:RNA polymerase nonessential primary-like sigma factor